MFGSPSKSDLVPMTPQGQRNPSDPWQPPVDITPAKVWQPEIIDVDMDPTPTKPTSTAVLSRAIPLDDDSVMEVDRPVSKNGMRRVFKKRSARSKSLRKARGPACDEESDDVSEEEEGGQLPNVTNQTSHHFTLNMPSALQQKSELPFLLLGYIRHLCELEYLSSHHTVTSSSSLTHLSLWFSSISSLSLSLPFNVM